MSKIKVFFVLFLVFLVAVGIAAIILPYHTYYLALNEGIQNNYIDLPKYPSHMYEGKVIENLDSSENEERINRELWRPFPIENYNIPIPYQNPLFVFVPDFKFVDGKERIGFSLISNQAKFYNNFMMGGVQKFSVNYQTDWIFKLPYFNKYIRQKKPAELWKDILTKKISFPEQGNLSIFQYAQKILQLDLHAMVYNIFILKSRKAFLPEDVIDYAYFPDRDIAIVEMNAQFGGTKLEKIYMYHDGLLYTYYMESSVDQAVAKYVRWYFINNIRYEVNQPEKAIGLYNLFRDLKFHQKTAQEGLVYLYSAWSLNKKKSEFMKEMIQYLERGPSTNLIYLKPLYKYALKNFKTTFSLRDERLLETEEQRKQRLKEEEQKRLDAATKIDPVDQFEKQEDKANYLLQKAKNERREKLQSGSSDKSYDAEEGVLEFD